MCIFIDSTMHYMDLFCTSTANFIISAILKGQNFHPFDNLSVIYIYIYTLIEGADVVRFIKAQRIKWLGHVQRMDQARPTGKLLDWKPMVTRPVGRPRQRWQEDVMEDLKRLKVKNWKETAKDKKTGGETWLRKRKPTKGCSAK